MVHNTGIIAYSVRPNVLQVCRSSSMIGLDSQGGMEPRLAKRIT